MAPDNTPLTTLSIQSTRVINGSMISFDRVVVPITQIRTAAFRVNPLTTITNCRPGGSYTVDIGPISEPTPPAIYTVTLFTSDGTPSP
jgi:hypothetical protein